MVWSYDECEAFVKSQGTVVPERCLKKAKGQKSEEDQPDPNYKKNGAKAPWQEQADASQDDQDNNSEAVQFVRSLRWPPNLPLNPWQRSLRWQRQIKLLWMKCFEQEWWAYHEA